MKMSVGILFGDSHLPQVEWLKDNGHIAKDF